MLAITLPVALVIIAFFAASTHCLYYRGQRQMERFRSDQRLMESTVKEELRAKIRNEMEWERDVAKAIIQAAEAKEKLPDGAHVEVMQVDSRGFPHPTSVKVK